MVLDCGLVLTTVHDALGQYEGAETVCKGAGDQSEDTQRPADPDDVYSIRLVPSDKIGHDGPTEIRDSRRHGPDDRYIRIILEFG